MQRDTSLPDSQSGLIRCRVRDLGLIRFEDAYQVQKNCVAELLSGGEPVILLCEHPLVFTLGRMASEENFHIPLADVRRQFDVHKIDRGGEVTLHCPGQLVVYPIFNLTSLIQDLRWYMRQLESVIIDTLAACGVEGGRVEGKTGVWVGSRKIASIGIGVKRWVSFHGLALNVNTDLNYFSMIRPCGLDVTMTSLAQLAGAPQSMSQIKEKLLNSFASRFNMNLFQGGRS